VEVEAMKVGIRKTVAKSNSAVLISAVRELLPPVAPAIQTSPDASTITQVETEDSTPKNQGSTTHKDDIPQAS
jgi:hypothetical protein